MDDWNSILYNLTSAANDLRHFPDFNEKSVLRITNVQITLQEAFRGVGLKDTSSPPATGGGECGLRECGISCGFFFSPLSVVDGRAKREWGRRALILTWGRGPLFNLPHNAKEISIGGMSCTAQSGIYLFGVCIMLRHLCSPLAQHIWLHNSCRSPEKQGQEATYWSKCTGGT